MASNSITPNYYITNHLSSVRVIEDNSDEVQATTIVVSASDGIRVSYRTTDTCIK